MKKEIYTWKAFKKTIGLFLALALAVSCATPYVHAYPTLDTINILVTHQEKSNWCWAACGKAVVNYYGNNITQSNFSMAVKNNSSNNSTATIGEICNGLSHWNIHNESFYGTLGFDAIRANIYYQNRPIIIRWQWKTGGGHVVVIKGYNESETQYVIYMDPLCYSIQFESYTSFVEDSSKEWSHTIYKIY